MTMAKLPRFARPGLFHSDSLGFQVRSAIPDPCPGSASKSGRSRLTKCEKFFILIGMR